MSTPEWPAERIARLRVMWANPDLSQRAIGRELGVSAGAVGSKAHRMGLGHKAMHEAARMHAVLAGKARREERLRRERAALGQQTPPPTPLEADVAMRRACGEAPLPAFHPISWGVLRPRALEP